jgi:hypothetical protein
LDVSCCASEEVLLEASCIDSEVELLEIADVIVDTKEAFGGIAATRESATSVDWLIAEDNTLIGAKLILRPLW